MSWGHVRNHRKGYHTIYRERDFRLSLWHSVYTEWSPIDSFSCWWWLLLLLDLHMNYVCNVMPIPNRYGRMLLLCNDCMTTITSTLTTVWVTGVESHQNFIKYSKHIPWDWYMISGNYHGECTQSVPAELMCWNQIASLLLYHIHKSWFFSRHLFTTSMHALPSLIPVYIILYTHWNPATS